MGIEPGTFLSLYPILRCIIEPSPIISESRSYGYPVRIERVIDRSSVDVRMIFSRARVTSATIIVLIDYPGRSVSGSRRVAKVLPLKKHGDFTEGRPLGLLASPTVQHQIVDILGAGDRLR